jgi:hypothetical protein
LVVRNLLHAHDLPAERLGRRRLINLPGRRSVSPT